jgi:hypothetical protein
LNPSPDEPAGVVTAIDVVLRSYEFSERHALEVHAEPARVYQAILDVTPGEIGVLVLLMALRTLPARLLGQARPASDVRRPVLDVAIRGGFVRLFENAPRELVLGAAGRFWTLRPGECVALHGLAGFQAFAAADHVRTAMDFQIEALGAGVCRLSTETRIAATDRSARRKFGLYWMLIRPGSGLIRRAWLRAIRRRAEAGAR